MVAWVTSDKVSSLDASHKTEVTMKQTEATVTRVGLPRKTGGDEKMINSAGTE